MDIKKPSSGQEAPNFLELMIEHDLEHEMSPGQSIFTRFPPEPNGYLHIGSAYAININYSLAAKYGGVFHLRFDDTNPLKEDMEYVNSIIEDMRWLGFDPGNNIFYGSDYSSRIYDYAVRLVDKHAAYVCDLSAEEIHEYRGTLTKGGQDSPYRNRTKEENLDLLERMRKGEFATGSKVLRAKIDMASPNINLRDPVLYRIIHAPHYRTREEWCIYPMYDFAHPLQDAIEGITHSLCSIEFRDHRPLYEWVLNTLEISPAPRQREFGRLNLTGTVTSKRYLRELVSGGYADGWDDPRLPTFKGLRRRGFTPGSIKAFLKEIGVARDYTTVDIAMLEHTLRDDLKAAVPVVMAVLRPLKVILTNYPEDRSEELALPNNPEDPSLGDRLVPFSRVLYIEKEDFMEHPAAGFQRLAPGQEVRLKGAYYISCENIIRDPDTGEIAELHCTYDPLTKSGTGFSSRKVKGTIHWVSECHAVKADVRLYDKLLLDEEALQDDEAAWQDQINPDFLTLLTDCLVEPVLADASLESKFQFMRHGYFCVDYKHSTPEKRVFNRIVPLKDKWKGGKAK
ncbi:glutamine--tRNA ligase/YqeY domain fusion protein [Paenibacillus sp. sptzw28]|uniref:glutamine--tRNA ligase/YqeY domain fusion protein n=1 Tax=Paenibacillus sp. sptzw28 TaxID=715179 RepID=UPI001C6F5A0C|nr:glutamine--tRNA ligase/YqeY domain fusion protein [Paenibacillus sp. sptzw28]QYR21507.1 glutamine--tRNA ligase/YqeY domain fusion protein [Paenibacillus sp. sptzw28]